MGRESEFKFFQRHTNGQHVHEKMLNITNQENSNWNPQWDSTSYLLEWLSSEWQETTSVGEKKGILVHCWCDIYWCSLMENSQEDSQNGKNRTTIYDPAISLLDIYLKETKALTWKDTRSTMFTAVLLTIAKIRKQPTYPSQMNEHRRCATHIHGILFDHKKKEILLFITTGMNLKSLLLSAVGQRQLLYGFTYMWNTRNKTKHEAHS